jgi:hypothetical protein
MTRKEPLQKQHKKKNSEEDGKSNGAGAHKSEGCHSLNTVKADPVIMVTGSAVSPMINPPLTIFRLIVPVITFN